MSQRGRGRPAGSALRHAVRCAVTQVVTSAEPVKVGNVDDDVERELAFYNQALEAAKAAVGELEARNVPWLRPRDYYAEMVKSDEHMARVKEQLMLEQKSIQGAGCWRADGLACGCALAHDAGKRGTSLLFAQKWRRGARRGCRRSSPSKCRWR